MDDLEPVPTRRTRRSCARRSRTPGSRRSTSSARARASPGVVGVLTGDDVARAVAPVPGGARPTASRTTPRRSSRVRYVGEPLAVVVARDRYVAEDAPSSSRSSTSRCPWSPSRRRAAGAAPPIHERSAPTSPPTALPLRRRRRRLRRAPTSSCASASASRARPRTPVECYGVVADWDAVGGRLTAWANFQGPFTLHGVAAAALGLPARPAAPADAARLGRLVRDQVGRLRLRRAAGARLAALRRAGALDRGPARAPRSRARRRHRAADRGRGRRSPPTASCRAPLRRVEDVGAYVRAPEPATLYRMHGSPAGAYRVPNVAVRNRVVLTNRCPTGLNRGFGGPQLYFALERTMAIAARRLGLDPAELARRNLVPRRRDARTARRPAALYDSGDYAALPRRGARARRLRRAARASRRGRATTGGSSASASPASSSRRSRTWATSRSPRRPRSARSALPKSGNAEGASIAIDPLGGDHRALRDDAAGPGAPHGRRAGRRRRARRRPGRRRRARRDRHRERTRGRSPRATTRRASPASARRRAPRRRAARRAAAAIARRSWRPTRTPSSSSRAAPASDDPERSVSLRRVAGSAHWNPEGLPDGHRARPRTRPPSAPLPNLDRPDADDRVASSAAHGFIVDLAVVEVDPQTGRGDGALDYVTVHDAGRLLNPLLADGQVRGGFAHGARRRRSSSAHVYDEDGNLLTALVRGLPRRRPRPTCRRVRIAHRRVAVAVHAARRQGPRRGQHDERARRRSRTRSPTRSAATTSSCR